MEFAEARVGQQTRANRVKSLLLCGAAVNLAIAAGAATAARAQSASEQTAQAPVVEEVIITGTRIIRDGYEAPTPLTVVGVEQLQTGAGNNIADYVNSMPALAGSTTGSTSTITISSGQAGINGFNLRNLGTTRTLVLLDGQRSVGAVLTGVVDVNSFPQQLVSRVDIVTGGASAAYGSDAVSGVVNFILDKTFTGFKGDFSGGVTNYGDDATYDANITAGLAFGNGRGHFLFSAEHAFKAGINNYSNRGWATKGFGFIVNPGYTATNGQPYALMKYNMGLADRTAGGIIISGPLKGIAFGPGGAPYNFNYGSIVSYPVMIGGAWQENNIAACCSSALDNKERRQNFFTRLSYDVTDSVNVYAQVSWAGDRSEAIVYPNIFSSAGFAIKIDNAFLPASVAAMMRASNVTSFQLGSMTGDLPMEGTNNYRRTLRNVVGAEGKVDALNTAWTWNAYFQNGVSIQSSRETSAALTATLGRALDAVTGPNGRIICRSTLTTPNDGCIPYNIIGLGVNTPQAVSYVTGSPYKNEHFVENVEDFSISGEPFEGWAGPISLATGIAHRSEKVASDADPKAQAGLYILGNYTATFGSYTVTEGFVETVVPLAKEQVWAKSLDFNAAVRATSYSTSGYVTTWKAGLTYSPIDDIKFRATRSRDIRAPNLQELFSAGVRSTTGVTNRFNGNADFTQTNTGGNPNLLPEKADSLGFGAVLQPSFFPGFSVSADYYRVNLNNAVGTLSNQQIIDQCYLGFQANCAQITFQTVNGASVISFINNVPINLAKIVNRGIDLEASYQLRLSEISDSLDGNLTFRALATNYLQALTDFGVAGVTPTDTAGQNVNTGPPSWRYNFTIAYASEPVRLAITARGLSDGKYNNNAILCQSGCPANTVAHPVYDTNWIPGAMFYDFAGSYEVYKGDDGSKAEVYLNVKNVFNTDPQLVANGAAGGENYDRVITNNYYYDILGRVFRAGVRFKM